jgi:hypothetical protein
MAKLPQKTRALAPIGDYPVGYCKPPVASQFKAGQPSANPKGRPKGSRNGQKVNPLPIVDVPIHKMVLEEAIRPVQVRDGDKVIKIPAYQAGIRATYINAAKGSNPAMRNAHLMTIHAEQVERERLEERVVTWAEYKNAAALRLAYCRARGIEFDWEIHPDDVKFDGRTGDIYIVGPLNEEEREAVKFVTDGLAFMHERIEEKAESIRQNPRLKKSRVSLGLMIEVINRMNAQLPTRLQREVDPDIKALAIMPDPSEMEATA